MGVVIFDSRSIDSGELAEVCGGHNGLSVMNDFSENVFFEILDVFTVSAVLRILHMHIK